MYRVFGPGLDEGACLTAASAKEAVAIISSVFGIDQSELKATDDIYVRVPRNLVLLSPGEIVYYLPLPIHLE